MRLAANGESTFLLDSVTTITRSFRHRPEVTGIIWDDGELGESRVESRIGEVDMGGASGQEMRGR